MYETSRNTLCVYIYGIARFDHPDHEKYEKSLWRDLDVYLWYAHLSDNAR